MATRTTEQVTFELTAKDRTAQAVNGMNARMDRLQSSIKKGQLAIAAATAVATAATMKLVTSGFRSVDMLAKQADMLGMSTESLIAYERMASRAGIEPEKFNKNLERMVVKLSQAAKGTGEAATSLEMLGLGYSQLRNLSTDDTLKLLADRIAGVSSESQRVRIAFGLFGEEGVRMLKIMTEGAAGFEKAKEEAEKLGLAISRIDAAKVEAANDAFADLKNQTAGAGRIMAVALAPAVEAVSKRITAATSNATWLREAIVKIADFGIAAFAAVGKSVTLFNLGLLKGQKAIAGLLEQLFSLNNWAPDDVISATQKIQMEIDKLMNQIATDETLDDWYNNIKNRVMELPTVVGESLREISFVATEVASVVNNAGENMVNTLATAFEAGKFNAKEMFKSILADINRLIVRTLIIRPLFGAIGGALGDTMLGNAFTAFANPGGKATGGPVTGGTPYLVGERGPELFVPHQSGNITPNNKMGGGSVTYNIDARGADAGAVARIEQALQRVNASIEPRSVQANINWRSRRVLV
jgi:hypothetical protein